MRVRVFGSDYILVPITRTEMRDTDDLRIWVVFYPASNGKVATFPMSQAGKVGVHFPTRGLLGCIPDPLGKLKNEFSVKPALPSAARSCGTLKSCV